MNSKERHEKRYQRRKAKRLKNKMKHQKSFSEVFTFENLVRAGHKSCNGVRWKTSIIDFESHVLCRTKIIYDQLYNNEYEFRGFKFFKTVEHGKRRDINALHIGDRAVQKCFCDNMLTEAYMNGFIYDNYASLPNRGMSLGIERLKGFLRKHYRLHGLEGGIYQFDFSGYFVSIPHDKAKERLKKIVFDPELVELGCQLIDDFSKMGGIEFDPNDPRGLGLGSQISQLVAVDFASPLDHYIKTVLRVKFYGRYMDDGYIISDSLEELEEIKTKVMEFAESLGIRMNPKKNIIVPFKGHSFVFLKNRFTLTPSGKVVCKVARVSIKNGRRKLYIFRRKVDEGQMTFKNVVESYQSWRSYAINYDSYYTVRTMDKIFVKLFEKELRVAEKPIKLHLKAKKDILGWTYE